MANIRISKWDNLDSDSDQFEDVYSANKVMKSDTSFGHGHSHGGQPCAGHHEDEDTEPEMTGHGHSHGGKPCDGNHDDESNVSADKSLEHDDVGNIKDSQKEAANSAVAISADKAKEADVSSERKVEKDPEGNIINFEGDYLVTSTNANLEGVHRKNWWGFAGRKSADSCLHELYQCKKPYNNYLVNAARKMSKPHEDRFLQFGESKISEAGPFLKVKKVVHTCVPRHPDCPLLQDGRTLPYFFTRDVAVDNEQAISFMKTTYQSVFSNILLDSSGSKFWLFQKFCSHKSGILVDRNLRKKEEIRICLPAIGCGINGYPVDVAADIAVTSVYNILNFDKNLLIEFHFTDILTLNRWQEVIKSLDLYEKVDIPA